MSTPKKFAINRQPAPSRVTIGPASRPPAAAPAHEDPIFSAMDAAAADLPKLLLPEAVAAMLGVTERTLERWRIIGEGPRYVKLTRSTVRYLADDVSSFIMGRLKANTAQ
jgi:predicted DNA-binding transcriptional regulator AlpA